MRERLRNILIGLGLLASTIAIILINLFDPNPPIPPDGPKARPDLAYWNSNSVENPDKSITTDIRIKWVNYLKPTGEWASIMPEFQQTADGFVADKVPFIAIAPLRSGGEAFFINNNQWDVFDSKVINAPIITEKIVAQGVADVPGVITTGDLGFGNTQYVLYARAYPAINADLIYWVHQGEAPRLSKLVRFNSAPAVDVQLPFLVTFVTENGAPTDVQFRWTETGEKMRWDKETNLRIEKGLSIKPLGEKQLRGIGLKDFTIWDAHRNIVDPIEVQFRATAVSEQFILTKLIPASFFSRGPPLEFPVYTDTVSTFYPDPDVESTSVDGFVGVSSLDTTFSTVRGTAGDTANDSAGVLNTGASATATANQYSQIRRSPVLFDTSAIPDTDTISDATLSIYGSSKNNNMSMSMSIVVSSPATNTALVAADFNIANWTMTQQNSTDITIASWSNTAYNDFALNATGIGNISKTGISKFGLVSAQDRANTDPTWVNGATGDVTPTSADTAGTTSDPKLVVTHASAATRRVLILD